MDSSSTKSRTVRSRQPEMQSNRFSLGLTRFLVYGLPHILIKS